MLLEVPIKIVPNINVSYKYKLLTTPFRHYIKDYNIKEHLSISKKKIVDTRLTSGSSILILYYRKYYWCPLFEDLYKTSKEGVRLAMQRSLELRVEQDKVRVTFTHQRLKYLTFDVKRLTLVE